MLFQPGMPATAIASTAMGFTSLGGSPGISRDGRIVTFYGFLSPDGARMINTNQPGLPLVSAGPGIFVSIERAGGAYNGRDIQEVTGTTSNIQSFVDDARVGIGLCPEPGADHRCQGSGAATIAYEGFGQAGKAIYTSVFLSNITSSVAPQSSYRMTAPVAVVTTGDLIPGLAGGIVDVNMYDPINSSGQLAFWVDTGLQQSIIRATPRNVNISQRMSNQVEGAIAINQNNPSNLVAFSIDESVPSGQGMFEAISTDGGGTWPTQQIIGRGFDGLPPSDGDVKATFDTFGNLFVTYITGDSVEVLVSLDGGMTFPQQFQMSVGALRGTSTGANTATTLNDTTQAWAINQWQNFAVQITGGTGIGQTRNIVSNTATTLIVSPPWMTIPDAMSTYAIVGGVDQPSIVVGPGSDGTNPESAWVTWNENNQIYAAGVPVNMFGVFGGAFSVPQPAPNSTGGNFGGIAIGPSGQVLVTYQIDNSPPPSHAGPANIYVNLKPDGLGPMPFNAAVRVPGPPPNPMMNPTTTVGSNRVIPAQSTNCRSPQPPPQLCSPPPPPPNPNAPYGIDSEPKLAWDTTSGVLRDGRIYLVYTDAPSVTSNDTNILLRASDDNGVNWNALGADPVRVNDDTGTNSQFLPSIALDPTTGNVAVAWYDCRNDRGDRGPGDTNGIPNDDAEMFAAVSVDQGRHFLSNVQIARAPSNAARSETPPPTSGRGLDFGDYSAVAFYNGSLYPLWSDNSNSTMDNPNQRTIDPSTGRPYPDGRVNQLNLYTDKITLVNPSSAGPSFRVDVPSTSQAGTPFDVTVTALDDQGRTMTDYAGTVTFSSRDPHPATLPDPYTFTTTDQGVHTFTGGATLYTAGTQDVTANDFQNGLTGSGSVQVTPAAADHLVITVPRNAVSGVPFDITISAVDRYGNVDTNYVTDPAGLVHLSSTDPDTRVRLPADFQFVPAMQGMVTFIVGATLYTEGDQTFHAADTFSGLQDDGSGIITVTSGVVPVRWISHTSGSWLDPNNWSTRRLPGPADDVVIDVPEDITVMYNAGYPTVTTIHSLLSENKLDIRHPGGVPSAVFTVLTTTVVDNDLTLGIQVFEAREGLTVNGLLTWTTGVELGSGIRTKGHVRANGGMLLNSGAIMELSGDGTIDNPGTATLSGAVVSLGLHGTWNNLPGSILSIETNANVVGGTFNNAGTVRKRNGDRTSQLSGVFHNTGTVQVESGTLSLVALGAGSGTFTVLAGATLEFNGDSQVVPAGAVITGAGDVRFRGGTTYVFGDYSITGATFVAGGIVNFTHDVTLQSLTLSGGAITGIGTVTVAGLLTWTDGTIRGPGRIVANSDVMITGAGNPTLDGRTFDNTHTATWTGTGPLTAVNGAVWNNLAGAVFVVRSDLIFFASSGGPLSVFHNAGTLRKLASIGTTGFGLALDNTGLVDVQTGTLSIRGTGNTGGTFTVQGGATLDFSINPGAFTLSPTSQVMGAGTVSFSDGPVHIEGAYGISGTVINGGTADFTRDVTLTALTLSGGSLTGLATVTVAGMLTWTGGTMSGPGRSVANGGLVIMGDGSKTLDNRTLDNAALAAWRGGALTSLYDATWNNLAGATFEVRTDLLFDMPYSGARFNNAGTFRKLASTGTTRMVLPFYNSGAVEVQTGTLSLARDGVVGSGSFSVAAGAVLDFNSNSITTLTPGSSVMGAGDVRFSSGTVFVMGSYSITGNTNVVGGTAQVAGPVSTGTLAVNDGTLQVFGDLTVVGRFDWNGGTLRGPGRILLPTPVSTVAAISGGGSKMMDGCTINSSRNTTWSGADIQVANGAVWNNLAGATFDVRGDLNFVRTDATPAAFNNAAMFRKSLGTGQTAIGTAFNNQGTVDVQIGTLALAGGGQSTGAFTVASGAAVAFGASSRSDNYILDAGTTIRGAGFATVAGGNLVIAATVGIDRFQLDGAGITGGGSLLIAMAFNWTAGQLTGGGSLAIAATATLNISGSAVKNLVQRTINNSGIMNWSGTGDITASQSAVLNNLSGATFNITNNQSFADGTCSSVFNNAGTVVKSGGGTTIIGLRFHNTGTVTIQSGMLSFPCGMFGPGGCSGRGGAGIPAQPSARSDALFPAAEPVRELTKVVDYQAWVHSSLIETTATTDGTFRGGPDFGDNASVTGDRRDRQGIQYDAIPVSRERESTERSAMSARHDAADIFFRLLAERSGEEGLWIFQGN
jgi:hypothetical protein